MLALHHTASSAVDGVRVLLALGAVLVVIFWRTVLKVAIMLTTVTILILITSGATTLLQGAHLIK